MLKEHADCLAAPLASIFNCSLREGVLPNVWKSANIIPLPKTKPLMSVKTDIMLTTVHTLFEICNTTDVSVMQESIESCQLDP